MRDSIKADLIKPKLKVYIVIIHYDFTSFDVEKVFLNRKQAEEYVKGSEYDDYSIIERDVVLTGGRNE